MTLTAKRIRDVCLAHGVDYEVAAGKRIAIPITPAPVVLRGEFVERVRKVSEAINRHLVKLATAWFTDAKLREVLVFPDAERRFLEETWRPGAQTIISRNDFDMPEHARDAVAFESNGCSIGGIWYGGAVTRAWSELRKVPQGARPMVDGFEVLYGALKRHARAIGAPARFRVGFLENRDWTLGITEMPSLARRLTQQGHPALLADPRDLKIGRGGFSLKGERVDLLYRNMELSDLVDLEKDGFSLKALREAFRANVVVSGLAGDFDQKSIWEPLTSRLFAHHIAKDDRAPLRKHLLWTRLFRDTQTDGFDGKPIDLVPYTLRNRARLVLKPNLLCGGEGVYLGPTMAPIAWERAVRRAVTQPGLWVVQRFHRASKRRFPGVGMRYVTCGVISSGSQVTALGRASGDAVVNVSRGGGLVPLFRSA